MNALVEINLALILFLPWFLILSVLFWVYPRQPRGLARRVFDLAASTPARELPGPDAHVPGRRWTG